MKRVVAICVTYKNSTKQLNALQKSLLENGITKNDQLYIDNVSDNKGYAGGINKALEQCFEKYDYFFIVNPDVVLYKNAIKSMLSLLQKHPDIGIVGPKIITTNGTIWSLGGIIEPWRYSGGLRGLGEKNKPQKSPLLKTDFVSGTAMLIKKDVFKAIGWFKEDYFLYYEDVDFCLRAKHAGYLSVIDTQGEIVHDASSSTGKNSPLMQYYMARNHFLIVERFAPFLVKIHELIRLPKTLWQAKTKKYELLGIRDYILRRFNKCDYWS